MELAMNKIDQKIEYKINEGDSWYESLDPIVVFGIALELLKQGIRANAVCS